MKKNILFLTVILFFLCQSVLGQKKINQSYMLEKQKIGKSGMIAYTSWSGANLIGGTIGWATTEGEWKYFSQMTTVWSIINLGISIPGLLGSFKTYENGVPTSQLIKSQYGSEQTYLINGGLDFLYIGSGAVLSAISNQHPNNRELLRGFGNAIMIQGGFLLIFDFIQYFRHRHQRTSSDAIFIDGLSLSNNGIGLKYTFK